MVLCSLKLPSNASYCWLASMICAAVAMAPWAGWAPGCTGAMYASPVWAK